MDNENKACAVCSHVHTKEDGTCEECGCDAGKMDMEGESSMPGPADSQ